jgi:hypothetical protein
VGIAREFQLMGRSFGLRADVLNVFGTTNYGGFDDWGGGPARATRPMPSVATT